MLDAEQRKEATGGGGADAGAAFRAELQALKAQLEAAQAVTWRLHGGYMMAAWRLHGGYVVSKAQLEAAQAVTWWLHGGYMMGTWR